MKKCLLVFLGLTLLFSSNHTNTLQTKYLPLITGIAAAVGGIIGYQYNKNISGKRLVESKHNVVVRWLFKKINTERHPERAAMLYRALYAFLTATASGGVAYGITYLFTPWGLSGLAAFYVGNKLQEPIANGDAPKNLEEVEKKFPNTMMQEYPCVAISGKLSNLLGSLRPANKWFQQAARDADKNDPKERALAENCTKRAKESKKPIQNMGAAKRIVMGSSEYKEEKKRILEELRYKRKRDKEYRKRDKEHRKWRKNFLYPKKKSSDVMIIYGEVLHKDNGYYSSDSSYSSPPPSNYHPNNYPNNYPNDSLHDSQPPGGPPPTGYQNGSQAQNYQSPPPR